jgi:myosin I
LPGATKPTAPAAFSLAPAAVSAAGPKAGLVKSSAGGGRAPPAPPRAAPAPPPPVDPSKEWYKALYNFTGQEGEMNLTKGELVEVKEKDANGELSS